MNLIKNIEQFNTDYVYFCDPIKNNIMNEGNFIRILYATPTFVLNGVYVSFNINKIQIEKYYNKYKCSFDANEYIHVIEQLRIIENNILQKINIRDKIPQHKIYEQFKYGHIKIFAEYIENNIANTANTANTNNNLFLLKIAGVWETDLYYGLTFKFIKL
jgi:hypothetical protein